VILACVFDYLAFGVIGPSENSGLRQGFGELVEGFVPAGTSQFFPHSICDAGTRLPFSSAKESVQTIRSCGTIFFGRVKVGALLLG
jgi:hypothetical protein